MYLKTLALLSALALSACGGATPKGPSVDEKAEVLAKLQTIDAATSISVNVGDYGKLLVDAKPAVDGYLASDNTSEFAQAVDKTFSGHRLAFDFWSCNLADGGTNDRLDDYAAQSQCRDIVLTPLGVLYPEIGEQVKKIVDAKEAELGRPLEHKSDVLEPDSIIQGIWAKTGQGLELAESLAD